MKRILVTTLCLMMCVGWATAEPAPVATSNVETSTADKSTPDTTTVKKSFLKKVSDFFSLDGGGTPSNPSRVSVIGGPYYESVSGLGISAVAASSFRLKGCDSTQQSSNVLLSGSITTKKFWDVMLKGNLVLPGHDFRINYLLDFEYLPSYYWGIGYENGNNPENKTQQPKHDAVVRLDMLFNLAEGLHFGPVVQWNYMNSAAIDRPELLDGQDRILRHYGFGAAIQYDTRDLITDAKSGCYLYLSQMIRPKFLWNKYAFSTTEFKASYYHTLWRDASLAAELCGTFNFGSPSWDMMAQVGDRYRMRGYYTGRYRDKHMWTTQVELRQHIWHRHGVVLWVGGGNIFHDSASFKHFLPNFGVGYRFEFRRRTNIRLDFGFAKGSQCGFMFNINEAF